MTMGERRWVGGSEGTTLSLQCETTRWQPRHLDPPDGDAAPSRAGPVGFLPPRLRWPYTPRDRAKADGRASVSRTCFSRVSGSKGFAMKGRPEGAISEVWYPDISRTLVFGFTACTRSASSVPFMRGMT